MARPQTTVFRGLTPGRRRRNQEYKDAVSEAAVNGGQSHTCVIIIMRTFIKRHKSRNSHSESRILRRST